MHNAQAGTVLVSVLRGKSSSPSAWTVASLRDQFHRLSLKPRHLSWVQQRTVQSFCPSHRRLSHSSLSPLPSRKDAIQRSRTVKVALDAKSRFLALYHEIFQGCCELAWTPTTCRQHPQMACNEGRLVARRLPIPLQTTHAPSASHRYIL